MYGGSLIMIGFVVLYFLKKMQADLHPQRNTFHQDATEQQPELTV